MLTNDGDGYDDRTGIFTCPVAGTYMFVVDSLSRPGIWLDLKVNKNTVGRLTVSPAYTPVDGENPLNQISRTVIVKLKPGDHVKVVNTFKGGVVYFHKYSGFTGFLLYWYDISTFLIITKEYVCSRLNEIFAHRIFFKYMVYLTK